MMSERAPSSPNNRVLLPGKLPRRSDPAGASRGVGHRVGNLHKSTKPPQPSRLPPPLPTGTIHSTPRANPLAPHDDRPPAPRENGVSPRGQFGPPQPSL